VLAFTADESLIVCAGRVPCGEVHPLSGQDLEAEIVNRLSNTERVHLIPEFDASFTRWADEASLLVESLIEARETERLRLLEADGFVKGSAIEPRQVDRLIMDLLPAAAIAPLRARDDCAALRRRRRLTTACCPQVLGRPFLVGSRGPRSER
jgi:hypothetical protein